MGNAVLLLLQKEKELYKLEAYTDNTSLLLSFLASRLHDPVTPLCLVRCAVLCKANVVLLLLRKKIGPCKLKSDSDNTSLLLSVSATSLHGPVTAQCLAALSCAVRGKCCAAAVEEEHRAMQAGSRH